MRRDDLRKIVPVDKTRISRIMQHVTGGDVARRLDPTLLVKVAARIKKPVQYVREQVSKRASRKGIVSEAELINWARELGISTGRALKALAPDVQAQARASTAARRGRERPRERRRRWRCGIAGYDARPRARGHPGPAHGCGDPKQVR